MLFYLSIKDKQFAIIGDTGINALVSDNFWESIKNQMSAKFGEGLLAEGLTEGIRMAGEKLKTYFPIQKEDRNELSDDLSFS
jgi:uncharacterized membrane protein